MPGFRAELRPPACEAVVLTNTVYSCNDCAILFTQIWPEDEFPLIEAGKLVLNENPENYFAQVEQMALSPAHMIPGIEPSPDKMLQVIKLTCQLLCFSTDGPETLRLKCSCTQFLKKFTKCSGKNLLSSVTSCFSLRPKPLQKCASALRPHPFTRFPSQPVSASFSFMLENE